MARCDGDARVIETSGRRGEFVERTAQSDLCGIRTKVATMRCACSRFAYIEDAIFRQLHSGGVKQGISSQFSVSVFASSLSCAGGADPIQIWRVACDHIEGDHCIDISHGTRESRTFWNLILVVIFDVGSNRRDILAKGLQKRCY